jgi:hypothetical protein
LASRLVHWAADTSHPAAPTTYRLKRIDEKGGPGFHLERKQRAHGYRGGYVDFVGGLDAWRANARASGRRIEMANARVHGLAMIGAGIALTPVGFGLAYLLGRSLQPVRGLLRSILIGLVALPMVVAFAGWLELITGAPFGRLAHRFDTAGALEKIRLSLLVIGSIIPFIALGAAIYSVGALLIR